MVRVFLSYSWSCNKLADSIEQYLRCEKTFKLQRDIVDLAKLESISSFMRTIRDCPYCILILNKDYLKSENCMFELSELYKEKDFRLKIIPIICHDSDIFNESGRKSIVQLWENNQINAKNIGKLDSKNIENILETLSDINSITYKDDNDIEKCCQEILQLLYNKFFMKEIRQYKVRQIHIDLPDDPILCIDFGTSYTLASIKGFDSQTYVVPDGFGNKVIPSTVEIFDDGTYIVGRLYHSTNQVSYTIKNIKRMIYTKKYYTFGENSISVITLIAAVLKSIYRNAEEYFGRTIPNILLSVPIDFRTQEMKIIKKAVKIAGMQIQRMIQESSVASLLISSSDEKENNAFINFDFGGGTLDISIAGSGDGICEVLYSLGDKKLGSIDYDLYLSKYIIKKLQEKYNIRSITPGSYLYSQVLDEAEKIKMKLNNFNSSHLAFEIENDDGNITYCEIEITKGEFISVTEKLTTKIEEMLLSTKSIAEKICSQYYYNSKHIYLTGQGAKLFLIKDVIKKVFSDYSVIDKYQENAVILGLSCQGGILSGIVRELLLLDNLHIYIDVLCDRYDEDSNTIYVTNNNVSYHNIIAPDAGHDGTFAITIPIKQYYPIAFENLDATVSKEYEIKFYDYYPGDKTRTYMYSLFFTPKANIKCLIRIEIDANGDFEMSICTNDDMKKELKGLYKVIPICNSDIQTS